MAILSDGIQRSPLMTESMILSLLDQCWYSQSILSHSIALYVLSVESESIARASETISVEATSSVVTEYTSLESLDDRLNVGQLRTSSEPGLLKQFELPTEVGMLEENANGLISTDDVPRVSNDANADGQRSGEEELTKTNTEDHSDGLTVEKEVPRTDTVDRSDAVTLEVEVQKTGTEDEALQVSHGKQVYTNYAVTGITGDGRCLFRAVAHGSSLRSGNGVLDEGQQRELADELRNKVADELLKRRDETEWFIEDDFDRYVNRIRQPDVWGGETELLMLSHVLKMPITVYMAERSKKGGLIAICEYGQQDYPADQPIQVLYDGFGHYDAVQIQTEAVAPSKL